jgi:hypothetical protein
MGADTGMNSSFVQTTMYISTYKILLFNTEFKTKGIFFEVVDNSVVNKFVVTEPVF